MQPACSALAPLSNKLSCETGSFSHRSNCSSPQSALSLIFTFSQPYPPPHCGSFQPDFQTSKLSLPCCGFFLSTHLPHFPGLPPTSLVDCFFNSLVVGAPCSLIFWHFWLFIVFRLVVILPLVVQGSKGFLPLPQSWPELLEVSIVITSSPEILFSAVSSLLMRPQKAFFIYVVMFFIFSIFYSSLELLFLCLHNLSVLLLSSVFFPLKPLAY